MIKIENLHLIHLSIGFLIHFIVKKNNINNINNMSKYI